MKYKLIISLILINSAIMPIYLEAQDFHLSQYDALPVILNPSLTGMIKQNKMPA